MPYAMPKLIFDKAAFHSIKWEPNQSTFIQSGSIQQIIPYRVNVNDYNVDLLQACSVPLLLP